MNARIGIAVAAAIVLADPLEAQKPGTFGVGVSIGQQLNIVIDEALEQLYGRPQVSFSFPMNLASSFRLEPELGFVSITSKQKDVGFETSASNLTFGVGGYFLMRPGDEFVMYAGPRAGMHRFSATRQFPGDPEESIKRTDIFFGVGLGGEHFFSSHLSLGAEGRLTYISAGQPKIEPSFGSDPDVEGSTTATEGLLFVRFYF